MAQKRAKRKEIFSGPSTLGYTMPAEWASHRATWLAWPHASADWPGKFAAVPYVMAEIVRHLSEHERVCIVVQNDAAQKKAKALLRRSGVDLEAISFHRIPTDRSWLRDTGPIFVHRKNGERMALCYSFRAWSKYKNWQRDAKVGAAIAELAHVAAYLPNWHGKPFVLEGGAIDVDGQGTLLATEECLLSDVQARNPGLSREDNEALLCETLGVRKVVWIKQGIAGDDTHGHIDDVARFVSPGRIVLAEEPNSEDENHRRLEENWERLEGVKDATGHNIEVIPLPMPGPVVFDGQRLPASYANFYIGTGTVLVPTFNDPMDRRALGLLAELFPERKVVGIHAVDLVLGLGTIHCLTQQEPA